MFLHLNPCWPRSAHDSRVFKESALYDQFEDGKHKGFLLGDSAYALSDYMMTLIMNPNPGPEERFLYFNQSNFQTVILYHNSMNIYFQLKSYKLFVWSIISIN